MKKMRKSKEISLLRTDPIVREMAKATPCDLDLNVPYIRRMALENYHMKQGKIKVSHTESVAEAIKSIRSTRCYKHIA